MTHFSLAVARNFWKDFALGMCSAEIYHLKETVGFAQGQDRTACAIVCGKSLDYKEQTN